MYANQLVHRACPHADVAVTVRHIPWSELGIAFHSDAGFGNAPGNKTQAGYILAFVNQALDQDQQSVWSPFSWKSYKMPRVVASTLAGETQSFSTASGLAEWMSLMIAEVNHGSFDLRMCEEFLKGTPIIGITDCKSLYDAIHSTTSPSKMEDKRVAIDIAIIRQCVARTGLSTRWCPTELMLADGLTKDQADPSDLLRAALSLGSYQLSQEATVLAGKREQRERRAKRQTQPRLAQSPLMCESFVDENSTQVREPTFRAGYTAVRRVCTDKLSGRVLQNVNLEEISSQTLSKSLLKPVPVLLTEIWYKRR